MQLFSSDAAVVVRLTVVLEGHLNIVCSYQVQAARTWAPAVVHVHGCSVAENCFDNGQAIHIHSNRVGHLLIAPQCYESGWHCARPVMRVSILLSKLAI